MRALYQIVTIFSGFSKFRSGLKGEIWLETVHIELCFETIQMKANSTKLKAWMIHRGKAYN
jgi:hypothetical protein